MVSVQKTREEKIEYMKELFFKEVEENTPDEIRNNPIFDLDNINAFSLILTKEHVEKYKLWDWFNYYKKEAQTSTGGIRGPQNVLCPWDHRFILHELGIVLATLGKVAVLKEKEQGMDIHKLCGGEVRYNTDKYIELISRLQAAQGIYTHQPKNNMKTSIFICSFLIFKNDYHGGEYVTSSHAISKKIATKDLNDQGSQFMPEESLEFVDKIEDILKQAETSGYEITFSGKESPYILTDFDGFDLYAEYLRGGVASEQNLAAIIKARENGMKIIFEAVGGCMHSVLPPVLQRLGIDGVLQWHHETYDPFFHGVGKKLIIDEETQRERVTDLSCDTTLREVTETAGYEEFLKPYPIGQMVFLTDPDADRFSYGQIEPASRIPKLEELEIAYIPIDDEKVFAFYMPNQGFLCTMAFYARQLKQNGLWNNHPRVMITTTASANSWVQWAENQGAKVVEVPVGFKEIAVMLRKIEKQIKEYPEKPVVVHDAYGKAVDIGVDPRLIFAGEESGGMIIGPEELITSKEGRIALSMREKSAGEAAVIATALTAHLIKEKKFLSEYLEGVFEENQIAHRFDYLNNLFFYDENEPDPIKLIEAKRKGELLRDKNDDFFTSIAFAKRDEKISLEQARQILSQALPQLDFSDMEDIVFVGDGVYFKFSGKFVENRKSGTDAKIKTYFSGVDKKEGIQYAQALGEYPGDVVPLHTELIGEQYLNDTPIKARQYYLDFLHKDL